MKLAELKEKEIKSSILAPWMHQTREEIENWIETYRFADMTINDDLTVSVKGDLVLSASKLVQATAKNGNLLPVQFKDIRGGGFICRENSLLSLRGTPSAVEGQCVVHTNRLISLKYGPEFVLGGFNCAANQLRSLEYAPETIGGDFFCDENPIDSLHNIHKQIKTIGGKLNIGESVMSNMLGILKIKAVKYVEITGATNPLAHKAVAIINKHLQEHRNIHECQEEMIEAGLKEYAKL